MPVLQTLATAKEKIPALFRWASPYVGVDQEHFGYVEWLIGLLVGKNEDIFDQEGNVYPHGAARYKEWTAEAGPLDYVEELQPASSRWSAMTCQGVVDMHGMSLMGQQRTCHPVPYRLPGCMFAFYWQGLKSAITIQGVTDMQVTMLMRQQRTHNLAPFRLPGCMFTFCWPGLTTEKFDAEPPDSDRAVRGPWAPRLPFDKTQGDFWLKSTQHASTVSGPLGPPVGRQQPSSMRSVCIVLDACIRVPCVCMHSLCIAAAMHIECQERDRCFR